jgi:hypothetical protein
MTSAQIVRAVARTTHESVSTIRSIGFQPIVDPEEFSDNEAHLWLDCPICGRVVHLADGKLEDLPELAECGHCESLFDYKFDEVFAAPAEQIAAEILDWQYQMAAV